MKTPLALLSVVLVAMSCAGRDTTGQGTGSKTTEPSPVTSSGVSPGESCGDNPTADCLGDGGKGNVVTSGEKVTITLGSFGVFKSSETIAHVYERGDGTQPDQVYLSTVVSDCATTYGCKGTTIEFWLNYVEETSPIELAQHGALVLTQNGVTLRASQGQVTVTKEGNGRLRLAIDGLEMGLDTVDAGVTSAQPVAPALIEGLAERICLNADDRARDPSNPFCSATD